MTNIEMLELAAKAAGYKFFWDYDEHFAGPCILDEDGFPFKWDPREDDGDAFRLMCALYLEPKPSATDGAAYCDGLYETHHFGEIQTVAEATRLVIFRAAVEIGKKMK
jgi:hypothetical protein